MITTGQVKTKRITVKTYKESCTVPVGYSFMLLQNHGLTKLRISFQGDSDGDYFGIDPDEKLPVINVIGGETSMSHVSETSDGILEILLWG